MHSNAKGVRLAALKLAQMSWSDRRWILSKLPLVQQQAVNTALTELRALNISNKTELLQQLIGSHPLQETEDKSAFRRDLRLFLLEDQNTITAASKNLLARCMDEVSESAV